MVRNSLTILFAPLDAIGHVNSSIGVAEVLQERGHKIVFAINDQWRGRLNAYGFEEELIADPERDSGIAPEKYWTQLVLSGFADIMRLPPLEKMKVGGSDGWMNLLNKIKSTDPQMRDIVNRHKPDIIIIDNVFIHPSLTNSGIPWVLSWSCNPLGIHNNESLPPPTLGLASNGSIKEWKQLKSEIEQLLSGVKKIYDEWHEENGSNRVYANEHDFQLISPYLNIYDYPEELDYVDSGKLPANYRRFDSFIRSEKTSQFEVPDKLKNKSGKLVYFSMGSMGAGDVKLMKRIISILSKSQHKFIVSMGQLHDQYALAHNMWGQKTVPQTKVLPIVDLVITHGGNNTVTESFYFGKPMIVMPLFADQYDNAQRIHESGYGIRLDPYNCSETELLEAIETILNDEKLAIKMNKISKRIQSSNSLKKVVEMIETLAHKN